MKTLLAFVVAAGALSFVQGASAQQVTPRTGTGAPASDMKTPGGCVACAQNTAGEVVSTRLVPGTSEAVLVGRIENLIPIGVLVALGCEKCAGEAVTWALQQGSSTEDIDRALRTLASMQTLDCFKLQFGADAAARLEKPLVAARHVLEQATEHGGRQQAFHDLVTELESG
jgi:alkylhydroperoxidase/carboxymuconolactone decarboxylase family protein YurZ